LITIVPPEQFNTIPWKNGKGYTTELAISDAGTIENFDWRLSIATVSENGPFSDFSGYSRTLILIDGNGIELSHGRGQVDCLNSELSFASFDGGWPTVGSLLRGPITDFNLMTRNERYQVNVATYTGRQRVDLQSCSHCFIYCLNGEASLTTGDDCISTILPENNLMHLTRMGSRQFSIAGQTMIVIQLASSARHQAGQSMAG